MSQGVFDKVELYTLLKVSSVYTLSFYEKLILKSLGDISNEDYNSCLYKCRDRGYIKDDRIRYENGIEKINSLTNSTILLTEKGWGKLNELKKSYLSKSLKGILSKSLQKTAWLWCSALIAVFVGKACS